MTEVEGDRVHGCRDGQGPEWIYHEVEAQYDQVVEVVGVELDPDQVLSEKQELLELPVFEDPDY